jgi:hypothetical protein
MLLRNQAPNTNEYGILMSKFYVLKQGMAFFSSFFNKYNKPHKAPYRNSSKFKLVPFNLRHNFDLR